MIIFILLLSTCIYYLASSNCCRAVYSGRWVAFVAWGTGSLQISITAQPCLKQMNSVIVNGGLNNQKKRSSGQKKNPQPLCPPQPESLQPQRLLKEIFYNVIYFISDLGKPVLLIVNYSKQGQGSAAQISYWLRNSVLFSKQSKCIHLQNLFSLIILLSALYVQIHKSNPKTQRRL